MVTALSFFTADGGNSKTTAEAEKIDYTVEQFADLQILRYRVPGFEDLSLKQKELVYYLTEAALQGRDILFDQNGKYNLTIRRMLEAVYTGYKGDKNTPDFKAMEVYLKRVWCSNGIHHHYGSEKFVPGFTPEFIRQAVQSVDAATLPLAEGQTVDYYMGCCRLLTDKENGLWAVTRNGDLWTYNPSLDKFECRNHLPNQDKASVRVLCADSKGHIWFSAGNRLIAYRGITNTFYRVNHNLKKISGMVEVAPGEYFVGSDEGLFEITMKGYSIEKQSSELSGKRCRRIHEMLFHPYSGRLIIADYSEGLMVWDTKSERMIYTWDRPVNSRISSLRTLDDRNVLVATDGEGLYRMDIINPEIRSFVHTDFENGNSIRTNRIVDLFVDDQKHIWVADYPEGVSMIDMDSPDDNKWYRLQAGNTH